MKRNVWNIYILIYIGNTNAELPTYCENDESGFVSADLKQKRECQVVILQTCKSIIFSYLHIFYVFFKIIFLLFLLRSSFAFCGCFICSFVFHSLRLCL